MQYALGALNGKDVAGVGLDVASEPASGAIDDGEPEGSVSLDVSKEGVEALAVAEVEVLDKPPVEVVTVASGDCAVALGDSVALEAPVVPAPTPLVEETVVGAAVELTASLAVEPRPAVVSPAVDTGGAVGCAELVSKP